MSDVEPARPRDAVPWRAIPWFVSLTFLITWGIVGFYIFDPARATAWFGAISGAHPLFFLATWAPAISAFVVVLALAGAAGLAAFLSRLLLWRISPGWAVFVLVVLPLVFVAGSLVKGGPVLAPLPPDGVPAMISILFMMLFLGPVEEFGWRGLLQPLLQRYMAPIWAGLVIGGLWGLWHLPAFHLAGVVFGGWDFWPFFIGNVVLAVLVTPILNRSRGGILWPMLFHWQLINPFWPDARPFDTWILAGVAVVVVWWNREAMFTRAGAATHVLATETEAAPVLAGAGGSPGGPGDRRGETTSRRAGHS